MRITCKVMEFVGLMLLFVGGGSIDSAPVVGLVMAFCGTGIAVSGASLEGFIYDGR